MIAVFLGGPRHGQTEHLKHEPRIKLPGGYWFAFGSSTHIGIYWHGKEKAAYMRRHRERIARFERESANGIEIFNTVRGEPATSFHLDEILPPGSEVRHVGGEIDITLPPGLTSEEVDRVMREMRGRISRDPLGFLGAHTHRFNDRENVQDAAAHLQRRAYELLFGATLEPWRRAMLNHIDNEPT